MNFELLASGKVANLSRFTIYPSHKKTRRSGFLYLEHNAF